MRFHCVRISSLGLLFCSGIPRFEPILGSENSFVDAIVVLQNLVDRVTDPVPCFGRARSARFSSAAPRVAPYPSKPPEEIVRMTEAAKNQLAGVGIMGLGMRSGWSKTRVSVNRQLSGQKMGASLRCWGAALGRTHPPSVDTGVG